MISGHGANLILFDKKNKDWTSRKLATSDNISFLPYHPPFPPPPSSKWASYVYNPLIMSKCSFCRYFFNIMSPIEKCGFISHCLYCDSLTLTAELWKISSISVENSYFELEQWSLSTLCKRLTKINWILSKKKFWKTTRDIGFIYCFNAHLLNGSSISLTFVIRNVKASTKKRLQ